MARGSEVGPVSWPVFLVLTVETVRGPTFSPGFAAAAVIVSAEGLSASGRGTVSGSVVSEPSARGSWAADGSASASISTHSTAAAAVQEVGRNLHCMKHQCVICPSVLQLTVRPMLLLLLTATADCHCCLYYIIRS
jgi:hypothetical protein